MNQAARAHRQHWDQDSHRYHDAHPEYLDGFYWGPEMLSEAHAQLLGDVSGKDILEFGCGSAPCSTWLVKNTDARFITGFDISAGMLNYAEKGTSSLVQADIQSMPFRDRSFDIVFSVYGALPFIPDVIAALQEVARTVRPGGKVVFSVNHPIRWIFPDDPDILTAIIPYFERQYVEHDENGTLTYAEYHRTFGDWIAAINNAGLILEDVHEPEWPEDLDIVWGQWSPKRGRIFPGTIIFSCSVPS